MGVADTMSSFFQSPGLFSTTTSTHTTSAKAPTRMKRQSSGSKIACSYATKTESAVRRELTKYEQAEVTQYTEVRHVNIFSRSLLKSFVRELVAFVWTMWCYTFLILPVLTVAGFFCS